MERVHCGLRKVDSGNSCLTSCKNDFDIVLDTLMIDDFDEPETFALNARDIRRPPAVPTYWRA